MCVFDVIYLVEMIHCHYFGLDIWIYWPSFSQTRKKKCVCVCVKESRVYLFQRKVTKDHK